MKSTGKIYTGANSAVRPVNKTKAGFEELNPMMENSAIGYYTCDNKGTILSYNKAASLIWGREPVHEKDLWSPCCKFFHPDGAPMPLSEFPVLKAATEGIPYQNQKVLMKRKDHSFVQLLVFAQPILNEQKKSTGVTAMLVDITDQQSDQLRQATLSAIVESSEDAIVSKDLNGIIKSWNRGAEKIFGYSEKEMLGRSITKLIPADKEGEEEYILEKIRKGEKVEHFQTLRIDKHGRKLPISLSVSPVRDKHGKVTGAAKIARDISSEVEAQEKIRKHVVNLEILNSIGNSISRNLDLQVIMQELTDATTRLTGAAFGAFFYNKMNEEGEVYKLFTLSGAPKEAFENLGMPRNTAIFHSTYAGKGVVRIDDITKDERYGKNYPHAGMPQGHLKVLSYLAVPVVSSSGTVIGALLFGHPEKGMFKPEHEELVTNIAAQAAISLDNSKLFEQVKSLSEKKDEFIALASHELKTPLTTIKGYLQVLGQKETDKMSSLFLSKALYQVNKLNALVEDLLNMSRMESGKLEFNLELFDLKDLLEDIAETFGYSVRSHKIIIDLDEKPAMVKADRQRMEQVVNNLVGNAIKYSPGADKVYLRLKVTGQKVQVFVKDEGIGLTPEQQKQLFNRYYRAENTQGISGLGLGLYLTKQIIDRHGGSIVATGEPGKGSEFSFSLDLYRD